MYVRMYIYDKSADCESANLYSAEAQDFQGCNSKPLWSDDIRS